MEFNCKLIEVLTLNTVFLKFHNIFMFNLNANGNL